MDLQRAFHLFGLTTAPTSIHEAKVLYHALAKAHHPDKNSGADHAMMQQVNEAWRVIREHLEESERSDAPNPNIGRPACTPAQITMVIRRLGIGHDTNALEGTTSPEGNRFKFIVKSKGKTVHYTARFQKRISKEVNGNLQFNCGKYQTQEEAAIASTLCRKHLEAIGAKSYDDIAKILGFDAKAFAKDIEVEVNQAINYVLSGTTPLLTNADNESE